AAALGGSRGPTPRPATSGPEHVSAALPDRAPAELRERLPLPHVSRRRNETCFDAPTRGTRHATPLCWFLDAPDSRSLAQQRGWPPIVKRTSPGSGRQTPAARGESSTDETQFFQPLVEHNYDAID